MRYRPRLAVASEVTIKREGETAVITFIDGDGAVNLGIGPGIVFMDDSQILALHNEVVNAQLDSAASWRPTEIVAGRPQIKFDQSFGQWSAQGHVLRCMIESGPDTDEPVIEIDEHRLSLQEFGALLSHFEGWGMRIAFVSEDQLCDPPIPEIRKAPKRISKKELAELAAENAHL